MEQHRAHTQYASSGMLTFSGQIRPLEAYAASTFHWQLTLPLLHASTNCLHGILVVSVAFFYSSRSYTLAMLHQRQPSVDCEVIVMQGVCLR